MKQFGTLRTQNNTHTNIYLYIYTFDYSLIFLVFNYQLYLQWTQPLLKYNFFDMKADIWPTWGIMNHNKSFTSSGGIFDSDSFVPKDSFYFLDLDHLQHILHGRLHQLLCLCLSSILMKLLLSNILIINVYLDFHNHLFTPIQLNLFFLLYSPIIVR